VVEQEGSQPNDGLHIGGVPDDLRDPEDGGNTGILHFLLDCDQLRLGTAENCDVTRLYAVPKQFLGLLHIQLPLGVCFLDVHEYRGDTLLLAVGLDDLGDPGLAAEDAVGHLDDGRLAPEVIFQWDVYHAREIVAELDQVLGRGIAEPIDGLQLIADHHDALQLLGGLGHLQDKRDLVAIAVLELIHYNVAVGEILEHSERL
jgi:hypothetical protein